jgi:hypothetical protein
MTDRQTDNCEGQEGGMRMDLAVPPTNIRRKINLIIHFLALIMILIIPSLNSAQETKGTEHEADCSIPKKLSKTRPHPKGPPTEVRIGFFFVDIKAVNDAEQTFTADVFRMLRWNDPRLSENSLGRSLEYCEIRLTEVWHPDLLSVNGLKGEKLLEDIVDVDVNGDVRYRQRIRNAEFFSDLDFRDFPLDTQILYVRMIELEHEKDQVSFVLDRDNFGMREELSEEGWDITLKEPVVTSEYIDTMDRFITRIDFRLSAERDSGYYLWKVILPIALIVLMAWSVFWIDPSQVGAQIGLSTATVFTLVAFRFSLGYLVPRVSYFTRMDKFVLLSTILVFVALAGAVATAKVAHDGNQQLARNMDRLSRVVYPILYAIIILYSFLM